MLYSGAGYVGEYFPLLGPLVSATADVICLVRADVGTIRVPADVGVILVPADATEVDL